MKISSFRFLLLAFALGYFLPSASNAAPESARFFFLHHSTGRNLLTEGEARPYLESKNLGSDTDHVLWDHDYNYIGLMNPDGDLLGYDFSIPDDNTDPDGLHALWTTSNTARDSILANYDIIAFKSCYPASDISTDEMLDQYRIWYLEIRDVLDQYPEITFVVMSQPPLHRLATNLLDADRARAFANWLSSPEYLDGHPNIVCFDFFDHLAHPDDGSDERNMLHYDFEASHTDSDSHPNFLANENVAPLFIDLLFEIASRAATPVQDLAQPLLLHQNYPNPFNPLTNITFELDRTLNARLQVLTLRGELVRELVNETLPAGRHEFTWNGRDAQGLAVSSGMYLFRLNTVDGIATGKMVLSK